MRRGNGAGLLRRGTALLTAAGTLWLVSVTAGSEDAGTAFRSLRDAAAEAVLREELPTASEGLSVPVILALRQTPLLYTTGDGVDSAPGNGTPGNGTPGNGTPGNGTPENGTPENGASSPVDESSPVEADREAAPEGAAPSSPDVPDTADKDTPLTPETGEPLQEEAADPAVPQAEPSQAAVENPAKAAEYQPAVENGMRARTLVPSSPDGYTVAGRVYISSSRKEKLDVSALLDTFDAHLTGESPQILIVHSHGSEAYTPLPGTEVVWSGDHRTTDPRYSVVKCGDVMAAAFGEAGISVLHDRTLYDYPEYTGSYDRSLAAINSYLAQYPSIHFILDVHRDSISDGAGNQYKVISEIEGVGAAAQLTLVMGSDGSGAPHPKWMENLKLAVAVQEQISGKYPTLMRPLLLRKSRYNQHATTGSLLVEVGASGNAPEEAQLAARLFAEEMAEVLLARTK